MIRSGHIMWTLAKLIKECCNSKEMQALLREKFTSRWMSLKMGRLSAMSNALNTLTWPSLLNGHHSYSCWNLTSYPSKKANLLPLIMYLDPWRILEEVLRFANDEVKEAVHFCLKAQLKTSVSDEINKLCNSVRCALKEKVENEISTVFLTELYIYKIYNCYILKCPHVFFSFKSIYSYI